MNSFLNEHQNTIIAYGGGAVVGVGCGITVGVTTFGVGMVGCAALAGAATKVVRYGFDAPAEEQTVAGYSDATLHGLITGAAGGTIAGVGGTVATGGTRAAITAAQRQTSNLITNTRNLLTRNTGLRTPEVLRVGDVKLPGVPKGAAGTSVQIGKGLEYPIPRGTRELDPRVTSVRIIIRSRRASTSTRTGMRLHDQVGADC